MVPPLDIRAGSEVLEVADRGLAYGMLADETFRLGPFRIAEVDRKFSWSSSWAIGEFWKSTETTGGYKFQFVNGKSTLAGKCATAAGETSVKLGKHVSGGSWFSKLGCQCEADGKAATLVIAATAHGYAGTLATSRGKYTVTSIHETEGGPIWSTDTPAGYRAEGDGPLGAVEALRPGRVWLKKGLAEDERVQTTCLFAGLMLYLPPEE
jgi:hypothetical protein